MPGFEQLMLLLLAALIIVPLTAGVLSALQVDLFSVAVSLSMVVTPLLFVLYDGWPDPLPDKPEFDQMNDEEKLRNLARESARELEEMFARDATELTALVFTD